MTYENHPLDSARSQRFSSRNLTIGELGADQERYVIPAYQRPYSWAYEQVSRLMQDLLDFLRSGDARSSYSLGTIVCDEETPGIFSILDGQQRLTTIDLLLGEIRRRLHRSEEEKAKRIISAYQYLSGMEVCVESPLPACKDQRNCIAGALTQFIEKNGLREELKTQNFLRQLEDCILKRCNIRRVVIPLSAAVENEAPAMFEIINMRGQKLSALDILKSRLLSRFSEEDAVGRALFTHLWRNTEERLRSPTLAEEGFDLRNWTPEKISESAGGPKTGKQLTMDEILGHYAENPGGAGDTSGKSDADAGNAEGGDRFSPPIDMMNMLVIASELLKHCRRRSRPGELGRALECQALTTTDFDSRFDYIVQAEVPGTADVWGLMGALSAVLQTVGAWGRYRCLESGEFEGELTAFNQLIQTFMAANSFSASAQYWLLLLSAAALEDSLGTEGRLPTDADSFLAMKKPQFSKIRKTAEIRLLAYAYQAAETGQGNATESVFRLLGETSSEAAAAQKLRDLQKSVAVRALSWQYADGSISQFDLFLTDYVLWADGHPARGERFSSLRQAMNVFCEQAQSQEETDLAAAFRKFDWNLFEEKAQTLRIIARSDIEHWLARSRADLGKEGQAAEDELARRHGYGNLALINANDNSSLGKEETSGKSVLVLERMSNPTPKLLWLAVLSRNFPEFDGRHVESLTRLWASYIGNFPFV